MCPGVTGVTVRSLELGLCVSVLRFFGHDFYCSNKNGGVQLESNTFDDDSFLANKCCPISETQLTNVDRLIELDLVVHRSNGHRVDVGFTRIGNEARIDGIVDGHQTVGTQQAKAEIVIIDVVRLQEKSKSRCVQQVRTHLVTIDEDEVKTILAMFLQEVMQSVHGRLDAQVHLMFHTRLFPNVTSHVLIVDVDRDDETVVGNRQGHGHGRVT